MDPVWHLYPVRVPADKRRTTFDALSNHGIGVRVNYLPAYRHPAFRGQYTPCPESEAFYAAEISLPMHVGVYQNDIERVAEIVRDTVSN